MRHSRAILLLIGLMLLQILEFMAEELAFDGPGE